MQTKLKLSEIIKTDCYIDCGSNEKLREVRKLLETDWDFKDITFGHSIHDTLISIYKQGLRYMATSYSEKFTLPIHHISEIDLNN